MATAAVKGIRRSNETTYELVDIHNAKCQDSPNDYFMISIGNKTAMFTLYHYYRPEGQLPWFYNPYRFIKNLSKDFDKAVKSALEYAGDLPLYIDADESIEYDYSGDVFQFGKYKGQKISEIAKTDINYLIYMLKKQQEDSGASMVHRANTEKRILENFANMKAEVEKYFEAKAKANRESSSSDFLGQEGDKVADLELTVTSVKIVEIPFDPRAPYYIGSKCAVKAIDSAGNSVKMEFASGIMNYRDENHVEGAYKKGDVLRVKSAKIKRNLEIIGVKTTLLNYVKFQ